MQLLEPIEYFLVHNIEFNSKPLTTQRVRYIKILYKKTYTRRPLQENFLEETNEQND